MTSCGNTKGASGMCANTAVSVILVRTYEEHARHFPLPKYWVLPTCTDCKPQFMAEYRDHDTITATIDTEPMRCRHCGATSTSCVIASEDDAWVQDDDDLGYPYCPTCVSRLKREQERQDRRPGLHIVGGAR